MRLRPWVGIVTYVVQLMRVTHITVEGLWGGSPLNSSIGGLPQRFNHMVLSFAFVPDLSDIYAI